MPGMNGRELGRRAQEIRPGLRVLYMTGYSRNAVVHHGRLDEGVELMQKPITQSHLAARIRDLLDRSQTHALASPEHGRIRLLRGSQRGLDGAIVMRALV